MSQSNYVGYQFVAWAAIPFALGGVVAGSLSSILFVALTPSIPVQFSVAGGLIAAGCLAPMLLGLGGFSIETAMYQAMLASFFLVAGTILLLASFGGLIAIGIFGSPNVGETIVGIIISFVICCVLGPCLVYGCCRLLLARWPTRQRDQAMNTQTQVRTLGDLPSGDPCQCMRTQMQGSNRNTKIQSKLEIRAALMRHENVTDSDKLKFEIEHGESTNTDSYSEYLNYLLRNQRKSNPDSNENNPAPVKLGEGITMSQGGEESRSTQGTANNNQEHCNQQILECNAAEFHEVGSGTCISSNDGEAEGDVLSKVGGDDTQENISDEEKGHV